MVSPLKCGVRWTNDNYLIKKKQKLQHIKYMWTYTFKKQQQNLDMSFLRYLFSHPKVTFNAFWCYSTRVLQWTHFSLSAKWTLTHTHICTEDINVSQVTSISQMLWACFKAQGIPWQESRSTFGRNFPISKSALLDLNKMARPTCLALVTSF